MIRKRLRNHEVVGLEKVSSSVGIDLYRIASADVSKASSASNPDESLDMAETCEKVNDFLKKISGF